MKTSIFIVVVSMFLLSETVFSQGADVAKELKKYIDSEDSYAPATKSAKKGTSRAKSEKKDELDKTGSEEWTGIKIKPKDTAAIKEKPEVYTIGGQQVDDVNSVIFKAFKQHSEWKNELIVADWTGSMYAYVGQVMKWHKRNMDKKLVKYIVLFNDGDDKKRGNAPKIIGKTGGIYFVDPSDMDDFMKKVALAIDNGDGGDSEENDLEAVIAAFAKHPDAKDAVLIADNTEVRDIELLSQVKKPVHVLLCNGGFVLDYVKIAYETGGSITTIEDELDFSDKSKIDPNNIIFNGIKYNLKK